MNRPHPYQSRYRCLTPPPQEILIPSSPSRVDASSDPVPELGAQLTVPTWCHSGGTEPVQQVELHLNFVFARTGS